MRRFSAILPLLAALALPLDAAAQISDGDTYDVAFKDVSGYYGGVALPFYKFEIDGVSAPGGQYWDFLCVDNLNYIYWGDEYEALFTSVESGDLGHTREGSDNPASALRSYRITAYLYLQAQTATASQLALIQKAAWFATNTGYTQGENSYFADAADAVDDGFTANNFYVVTATGDWDDAAGRVIATGGKQEYLVYVPVPEPATFILLATSLLGVAFVGRRRRLLEDSC